MIDIDGAKTMKREQEYSGRHCCCFDYAYVDKLLIVSTSMNLLHASNIRRRKIIDDGRKVLLADWRQPRIQFICKYSDIFNTMLRRSTTMQIANILCDSFQQKFGIWPSSSTFVLLECAYRCVLIFHNSMEIGSDDPIKCDAITKF